MFKRFSLSFAAAIFSFTLLFSLKSESLPSADDHRRIKEMVCNMSIFFSVDPQNAIAKDLEVEGRGLVHCRSDRGFTTDHPVMAKLKADIPNKSLASGELTLSANSSPFIVNREISQLYDEYMTRSFRQVSPLKETSILFRGLKHDLAIQLRFNSPRGKVDELKISGLLLSFDDLAPDLF